MKRFIRMNEKDMVATALEDTHKGEEAGIHDADNNFLCSVTALEDIPFGNKIALTGAVPGDRVVKYGAVTVAWIDRLAAINEKSAGLFDEELAELREGLSGA